MLFLSVEPFKNETMMEMSAVPTRRICGVSKRVAKIDRDAISHDVGYRSR